MPERDVTSERVEKLLHDGARRAYLGEEETVCCHRCGGELATEDGFSGQANGRRVYFCASCNLLEEPMLHDEWPVHQPECFDAPIPGRQWYGGCEPGGDWDSELGRYDGIGPRVDPATGICESCGAKACRECGRENCPDHPTKEEPC